MNPEATLNCEILWQSDFGAPYEIRRASLDISRIGLIGIREVNSQATRLITSGEHDYVVLVPFDEMQEWLTGRSFLINQHM